MLMGRPSRLFPSQSSFHRSRTVPKNDDEPVTEVVETAAAPPTDDLSAKVDEAIDRWVSNYMNNSPVARNVESINHVRASLGSLRDMILQVVK